MTLPFEFGSKEVSALRSPRRDARCDCAAVRRWSLNHAAHQNPPVRLDRDGKDIDVCVRVKRIRRSGRRVEPGNAVACLPADVRELPPTRILPSAWMAIALTKLFAFGLNASAAPVAGSRRAMRLRVCPPMVVNAPPAIILPSAWTAIAVTEPFAFGSNASAAPVAASRRAIRLRVCPPMDVNTPPARILPSALTAMAETSLSAFGLNESALPIVASSRAIRLRFSPPMVVK